MDDRPHHTHETMENSTPFDLNEAVHSWRHNLAASPSLTAENLDELESHLRDGIGKLQPIGLSPAEAFMVARVRIGSADRLDAEFEKANPERLGVNRLKWMLAGVFTLYFCDTLSAIARYVVAYLFYCASSLFAVYGFQIGSYLPIPYDWRINIIVGIVPVIGLIRVAKTQSACAKQIGAFCDKHPLALVLAVLSLIAVMVLMQSFLHSYMDSHLSFDPGSQPSRTMEVVGSWINIFFVPVLLAWVFVRASRPVASK